MRGDRFELQAGHVIERYELLLPASASGPSRVWAARLQGTRGFGKLVALKTFALADPAHGGLERMLPRAAQIASRIQHSNVAQCFDLVEHPRFICLTMEWIDGESLACVLREASPTGGMPLGVALQIVVQACNGLHAAHALCGSDGRPLGLVHGDVSPQSLMIDTSGSVKLLNFGMAELRQGRGRHTVQAQTPFTAPEQALGQQVDLRADIFSLGVVLYLLTTGVHPFSLETAASTRSATGSDLALVRPSSIVGNYPAHLERVLMRALARRPEERFQSAAELREALVAAFPGYASEAELAQFLRAVCGSSLTSRRTGMNQALQRLGGENCEPPSQTIPNTLSPMSLAYLPADLPRGARRTSVGLAVAAGVLAFIGGFAIETAKPASNLVTLSRATVHRLKGATDDVASSFTGHMHIDPVVPRPSGAALASPLVEGPLAQPASAGQALHLESVGTAPAAAPTGLAAPSSSAPQMPRATRRRTPQPAADRYGI